MPDRSRRHPLTRAAAAALLALAFPALAAAASPGAAPGAPKTAPAAKAPAAKAAPAAAPKSAAVVPVPGSGGVLIDGVLLPPERVWSEYRYQYCSRAMIHSRATDAVDEQLLATVVEQVVGSELLAREAARRGLVPASGEEEAVRAAEVQRWRGEEKFRTACKLLQVDEPFLVARGMRQKRVEALAARDSGAEENLTEAALEEHYREHSGEYLPKGEPPLRYMFVPMKAGEVEATLKEIMDEADAIRERGGTFHPIVARHSTHESAASGGVIPELAPGAAGLPFQPPAGKLKECRVRGFPEPKGYHFYLRDCRQPPPLAEIREKIRESLVAERRRAWVRDLLAGLRAAAKIERLTAAAPPPPQPTGVAPGAPAMQPRH